ncbi:hypothetical protein BV22DRAFT_1016629, partial [Leucogyrophana mollusca]
ANYFESTHPTNPIYPDGSRDLRIEHVDAIAVNTRRRMVSMAMATTPSALRGRDRDAFVVSRTEILGSDPAELYAPEKRGAIWAAMADSPDVLAAYIDENGSGKGEWAFGGGEPAYADFVFGAAFVRFEKVGSEGGRDRIKGRNRGR